MQPARKSTEKVEVASLIKGLRWSLKKYGAFPAKVVLLAISALATRCNQSDPLHSAATESPPGTSIKILSDMRMLYPYPNAASADFRNFTYHPADDYSFRLENGRYEESTDHSHVLIELEEIQTIHPLTIVHVSDAVSSGSSVCAEYLFFFSNERRPLTLLNVIDFRCTESSTEYRERTLTIRALSNRIEDGNCCPRFVDEVDIDILDDGRLRIRRWRRTDNANYQ
jgi:hypothetical protein